MLIPLEGDLAAAFQELDRAEIAVREKRNGMVIAVLAMKGVKVDASVAIEVRPDGIYLTPNGK